MRKYILMLHFFAVIYALSPSHFEKKLQILIIYVPSFSQDYQW